MGVWIDLRSSPQIVVPVKSTSFIFLLGVFCHGSSVVLLLSGLLIWCPVLSQWLACSTPWPCFPHSARLNVHNIDNMSLSTPSNLSADIHKIATWNQMDNDHERRDDWGSLWFLELRAARWSSQTDVARSRWHRWRRRNTWSEHPSPCRGGSQQSFWGTTVGAGHQWCPPTGRAPRHPTFSRFASESTSKRFGFGPKKKPNDGSRCEGLKGRSSFRKVL